MNGNEQKIESKIIMDDLDTGMESGDKKEELMSDRYIPLRKQNEQRVNRF